MNNIHLDYEIIIIGAGISGIGAGIFLKKQNINNFALLESQDELGGTWRDNTYPGIAVDIASVSYSFSFEPNPDWSCLFVPGHEIQQYVKHCAQKYQIIEHIRYKQKVEKIVFDESNHCWIIHLNTKETLRCRFVISATGILNQPKYPKIEGIDVFAGKLMHTARWDHDYDFSNKRVGIIGTGASAVQLAPAIADSVKRLDVYQRTPIWIIPKHERVFNQEDQERFKKWPITQKIIKFKIDARIQYETWGALNYKHLKFATRDAENQLQKFITSEVTDTALHQKLIPQYGLGCKRPSLSNTYLKTFNKTNVNLITEGIQRITAKGILTNDGKEHELDLIVLGTGFKTFERGNSPSYQVYGLNNLELGLYWENNRYQAYRGLSVHNFPNYFMTFGPNTGQFNWFSMLESQLTYIVRGIVKAYKKNATYMEVSQKEQDKYFKQTLQKAKRTIFHNPSCHLANSYYFDAKGDAALPSMITPFERWFSAHFASHSGYIFKNAQNQQV